jgi:O-antigen ligase
MTEYRADTDIARMPPGRLDTAVEALLIALLAFMPLAFGARSAWSEEVVIALSGAIVVCFLLKVLLQSEQKLVWTWAYVPLGLFVLIAVLQLVPLPSRLAGAISPNTVVLRQELLGDMPGSDALLKAAPLTFYPNATRHDLRLILSIAAVFVVVVSFFRRPDQIKRILMAIALIGGVIAAVTLAQDLFGNGRFYWFISGRYPAALSGPFVNHNHYGQFMNLSIGATLAWLCVALHEHFAAGKLTPSVVYDYLGSSYARPLWLLVAIMALGTATIFISLTRGGMVSMLIASVIITVALVSRPSLKSRGWIMVIMALGAFACILYVGFDAVYDRFATLGDSRAYEDRSQILKDLVASYSQFPVLGTGLGTHAMVYPMFKSINKLALFTHAENEYAQLLEETGLTGLVLLLIFGLVVLFSFVKNIRSARLPIRSAAYGLGFGLLAILIHSFSDFGQHLPANAFLSATFCALLLSLAGRGKTPATQFRLPAPVVGFLIIGVCGVWTWGLVGADRARRAEACWAKTRDIEKSLVKHRWQGSGEEYAELLSGVQAAMEREPDNVTYRYRHAAYRWHAVSQTKDLRTGTAVIDEDAMPEVHGIVASLHKVCLTCPVYGPPYSLAGQIEKFVLNDPNGAEDIRKGFRLAPSDPVTCFAAARLDVLEGRTQDSIPKFEKAVTLDPGLFREVVDIFIYQLSRPLSAISMAGDDIGRLSHVANVLDTMLYLDLAEQVRAKRKGLLEAKCSQPDASASALAQLGSIYSGEGNDEAAAECYRQALAREYGQIQWRLELATLLARSNKVQEAIAQAKICLQLRPQFRAARTLVEDLSVHPELLAGQAKPR